jgi:hypothetical protein
MIPEQMLSVYGHTRLGFPKLALSTLPVLVLRFCLLLQCLPLLYELPQCFSQFADCF